MLAALRSMSGLATTTAALAGLGIYCQCAAIDAGAVGGFVVSNGVEARIGY